MKSRARFIIMTITNTIVGFSLGYMLVYNFFLSIYNEFRDSITFEQRRFLYSLKDTYGIIFAIFCAFLFFAVSSSLWIVFLHLNNKKLEN